MSMPAEALPPPVPDRPTLIPELPGAPEVFDDIAALGRRLAALADGRPLRLRPVFAAWDGSETFDGFTCWRGAEHDGDGAYLGVVAVPGSTREALDAAIAAGAGGGSAA